MNFINIMKIKKNKWKIIIGGDFNVIQSKNDCYDIKTG